jgi:Replication initiation factor
MSSVPVSGRVVTAGVDWVTATAGPDRARGLLLLGEELIEEQRKEHNRVRPWQAHGYRGWISGAVSVGARADGSVLRVTGGDAARHFQRVEGAADNLSRVDVQASVYLGGRVDAVVKHHATQAERALRGSQTARRSLALINTFGRGDTLYIGSRSSNYYGRVYNKHRESGEAQDLGVIRYELEAKNEGADRVRGALRAAPSQAEEAVSIVRRWYRVRGVIAHVDARTAGILSPVGRRHREVLERLTWLQKGVRPSVRRLSDIIGRDRLAAWLLELDDTGQLTPEQLLSESARPSTMA